MMHSYFIPVVYIVWNGCQSIKYKSNMHYNRNMILPTTKQKQPREGAAYVNSCYTDCGCTPLNSEKFIDHAPSCLSSCVLIFFWKTKKKIK